LKPKIGILLALFPRNNILYQNATKSAEQSRTSGLKITCSVRRTAKWIAVHRFKFVTGFPENYYPEKITVLKILYYKLLLKKR